MTTPSPQLASPPPTPDPSPGRTVARGLLAVLGVVLVLFGAATVVAVVVTRTETRTETFPAARTLRIDTGSGDVRLVGSDRTDVRVERRVRWSWRRPAAGMRLEGDSLVLDSGCGAVWFGTCRVDFQVEVPATIPVEVRSGSGDVVASDLRAGVNAFTRAGDLTVRSVTGPVTLRSSSGEVRAEDLRGDLTADAGSGDIRVERLQARRVQTSTASGDLVVSVTGQAPDEVAATTRNGDIRLRLPDETYRVDVDTRNGDVVTRLRTDPAAPRRIHVRTANGDIILTPS